MNKLIYTPITVDIFIDYFIKKTSQDVEKPKNPYFDYYLAKSIDNFGRVM